MRYLGVTILFCMVFIVCTYAMEEKKEESINQGALSAKRIAKRSLQEEFEHTQEEQEQELGQEPELESEQGKAIFVGSHDIIPYRMKAIYDDPDLNAYAAQSYVLTQPEVIDAMNKAVEERGATVDLSVGVHHSNRPSNYKVSSVRCDKEQHGKNIVGLSCSPSKGEPTKAVFLTGSANATNAVWPTGNPEAMVYVEGDVGLSKVAYALIKSQSPAKEQKEVVENTPTKRAVFSSRKTRLNKSRARRILTVAQQVGDDRIAWASSMNINDGDMANALSEAAKSGVDTRLIVHKTALTKHGIPLLQLMADAGVQVYVYYPAEGARKIQHKKELIRKDLYIVSNANFTDEGDFQKNLETYFPQDFELVAKAKEDFERIQGQSVSLEKALELHALDKEKRSEKKEAKKAKKREAEDEIQGAEAKKRKTTN